MYECVASDKAVTLAKRWRNRWRDTGLQELFTRLVPYFHALPQYKRSNLQSAGSVHLRYPTIPTIPSLTQDLQLSSISRGLHMTALGFLYKEMLSWTQVLDVLTVLDIGLQLHRNTNDLLALYSLYINVLYSHMLKLRKTFTCQWCPNSKTEQTLLTDWLPSPCVNCISLHFFGSNVLGPTMMHNGVMFVCLKAQVS